MAKMLRSMSACSLAFLLVLLCLSDTFAQWPKNPLADKARRPALKARQLTDKALTDKEQQRYESKLAGSKSHLKTSRRASEQLRAALALLEEGSVALQYGQEQKATQSFKDAWQSLVEAWKKTPSTMPDQIKGLKKHFTGLSSVMKKNPDLALTILVELDPFYADGSAIATKSKDVGQYSMPIAELWGQLTRDFELDKADLEKAVRWIEIAPAYALAGKPLNRQQKNEYQIALSQAENEFDLFKAGLQQNFGTPAFNDPAQPLPNQGLADNAAGKAGQRVTRRTQGQHKVVRNAPTPDGQLLFLRIEDKRLPLTLFFEASAHMRYGQEKQALIVARRAWAALLSYYRKEPTGVADYDDAPHLKLLDDLTRRDSVRAWVLMRELDDVYQQVLPSRPILASEIADCWIKIVETLPVGAFSLKTATAWIEQANRLRGNTDKNYTQMIATIKKRLSDLEKPQRPQANIEANENKPANRPADDQLQEHRKPPRPTRQREP